MITLLLLLENLARGEVDMMKGVRHLSLFARLARFALFAGSVIFVFI